MRRTDIDLCTVLRAVPFELCHDVCSKICTERGHIGWASRCSRKNQRSPATSLKIKVNSFFCGERAHINFPEAEIYTVTFKVGRFFCNGNHQNRFKCHELTLKCKNVRQKGGSAEILSAFELWLLQCLVVLQHVPGKWIKTRKHLKTLRRRRSCTKRRICLPSHHLFTGLLEHKRS